MSFNSVNNLPNFSVRMSNTVPNALEEHVPQTKTISQIWATITYDGNEVQIQPIGLINQGYFEVTEPGGPSITFSFILNNAAYSKVTGVVSVNSTNTLTLFKPSDNVFEFTIGNISNSLLATVALSVI